MTTTYLAYAAAAIFLLGTIHTLTSWRRNVIKARSSGLNYIIGPCSPYWIPWSATAALWVPIFRCLGPLFPFPKWLNIAFTESEFLLGHTSYAAHGEAYLIVSPFNILFMTDNPDVIHQITHKRDKFPKNTSVYAVMEQFGPSVLSTEGVLWRLHRRVTAAGFNEKSAALVWKEAIYQAKGMAEQWMAQTENRHLRGKPPRKPMYVPDGYMMDPKTICTVENDTMKMTLHIIAYVGFGLTMIWPGQEFQRHVDPRNEKYTSETPLEGHTMNFIDSLSNLVEYVFVVLVAPDWLMNSLPFSFMKKASAAKQNYIRYMNSMLDERLSDIQNDIAPKNNPSMDLLGSLARSYNDDAARRATVNPRSSDPQTPALSRSDILGNIFVMMVAGHETSANVLHFMFLYLAAHPAAQRALVRDLDNLVGDTDPDTWDYETLFQPLLSGVPGACMSEVLRLMPPAVLIPKQVTPAADQTITLNNKPHTLPAGAEILLSAVSAARNPNHWPTEPSRISDMSHDLDDFLPARWFRSTAEPLTPTGSSAGSDSEDGPKHSPTSRAQFRPVRGSYVPFSDGPRSCLGRRVAQVEIMAAVAVVFKRYSIELAVDEWATDVQVGSMTRSRKREIYKEAQQTFRETLKTATSVITLRLRGNYVPVRFVKRGHEKFVDFVDDGEE